MKKRDITYAVRHINKFVENDNIYLKVYRPGLGQNTVTEPAWILLGSQYLNKVVGSLEHLIPVYNDDRSKCVIELY